MAPTRKQKQKKGLMTIPQLRKAFDHIEGYTQSLFIRVKDPAAQRKAFQAEWRKTFHRDVDDKAADAYLKFEAKKGKRGYGKTRKMKGGAQSLGGAPLDYSTRPGLYGPYGTFPDYISGGFVVGNKFNNMAIQEDCNGPSKFQPPYTGFGAPSQKGGTRRRKSLKGGGNFPSISEFASAVSLRPIPASATPTMMYDAQMAWKGAGTSPPPQPNTGSPGYKAYEPTILKADAAALSRNLGAELGV